MNKEKNNLSTGVGVGSLFSGLTREIIPVSKSTIENLKKVMDNKSIKIMGKTLQKEATNTAVDETIKFLNQKNIKKSKKQKQHLKKVARNILSAAKHKKASSQSQRLKQQKNKLSSTKKRKLKQNSGPNKKKSLLDDDY